MNRSQYINIHVPPKSSRTLKWLLRGITRPHILKNQIKFIVTLYSTYKYESNEGKSYIITYCIILYSHLTSADNMSNEAFEPTLLHIMISSNRLQENCEPLHE